MIVDSVCLTFYILCRLFVSYDGGKEFNFLIPAQTSVSSIMHAALIFPTERELLVLHGSEKQVKRIK